MKTSTSVLAIGTAILIGVLVALAGSSGGLRWGGFLIFAWGALLVFLVQWVVFVPSWFAHTEHFFDLTGSLTYFAVVALTLLSRGSVTPYSLLVATMVTAWALRLGAFLAARVSAAGSDSRFDAMKYRFAWFLMTWTLQGLWVLLTAGAALAAITSPEDRQIDGFAVLGVALWALGFGIEVAADEQKRRFRARPENLDRFITTGVWARSRHPNYFGDCCVWWGLWLVTVAGGVSLLTVASPVLMTYFLVRATGARLTEKQMAGRSGFSEYCLRTSFFIPKRPKSRLT